MNENVVKYIIIFIVSLGNTEASGCYDYLYKHVGKLKNVYLLLLWELTDERQLENENTKIVSLKNKNW